MIRITTAAVCLSALFAFSATAAEVATPAGAQPESLTVGPDGTVILGSASSPKIYRAKKGAATAEVWIDVSSEVPNGTFLGVLADAGSNTLWACQINNGTPADGRKSTLRGFDLKTGAAKSRWDLPSDTNLCNDMVVAPDKSLYVTDTFRGRIWNVKPGGTEASLVIDNVRVLFGVDGIDFLNGQLYVNTVFAGNLYRVNIGADGKGTLTEIFMDKLVKNPDGMRYANGKLFVAENGGSKVHTLTIKGDTATVAVIKEGLKTPTAVQPFAGEVWIAERSGDKGSSVPMPK
jgi:sugar lactone lactonase YvrE